MSKNHKDENIRINLVDCIWCETTAENITQTTEEQSSRAELLHWHADMMLI